MGKSKKIYMPFNEYMRNLQENTKELTAYGETFPNTNYRKIEKEDFKKLIYENTYQRLINILLKMYKWTVPESFNARALELGYITRGSVCAFETDMGKYALPCIPLNSYNIYGDPTQVQVYGYNGWSATVDIVYNFDSEVPAYQTALAEAKSVGVYSRDNDMGYPYIYYVKEYALKLCDKIVALHIATQKLKSPFIVAIGEHDLKDTVKEMIQKIENNDDLIIRVKQNKLKDEKVKDSIEQLNTSIAPQTIQALKDAINFDFNMFLETVGINTNPSPDKSQVVLTPELESNNSLIDIEQDIRYLNRVKFCEEAKKILNIDISVEKNIVEMSKEIDNLKKEMGGEDGTQKNAKDTE